MKFNNLILNIAVVGNIAYILWILYNGIDEKFADIGSIESVALIGLLFLLTLNIFLLIEERRRYS